MGPWVVGIQATGTTVDTPQDDTNSPPMDRDQVDLLWGRDQGTWVGNMVNMETLHLLTLGAMVHRHRRGLCFLNMVLLR